MATKSDEFPPNKAIAAAGGTSIAGAAVAVILWAVGTNPPMEIVIALTTIANAIVGTISVYMTPHGANK